MTTLDGLDPATRTRWLAAFTACGASQCGFCTPGIILRLEGLRSRSGTRGGSGDDPSNVVDTDTGSTVTEPSPPDAPPPAEEAVERALAAHLCRCTGWRPIVEAWHLAVTDDAGTSDESTDDAGTGDEGADLSELDGSELPSPNPLPAHRLADGGMAGRDRAAAEARALLEGGVPQRVGGEVAAGDAGFAADTVPPGALVALPTAVGGGTVSGGDPGDPGSWIVAGSIAAARQTSAKVQGRRTTADAVPPLDVPDGDWAVVLRTSWVDPAYLETDASWCEPGGPPTSPLANGGAFGGKTSSPVAAVARRLADEQQRCVAALFDREDAVRLGPKRPPVAIGVRSDGTGVVRVATTAATTDTAAAVIDVIASVSPALDVDVVDLPGPPTSLAIRGAGWIEAAVAVAAATGATAITSPSGATASATISADGTIEVRVACGDPLDEVVLRSYCTGAAHFAASWVTSESLAVDPGDGSVGDLTIRSLGVLRAAETPRINVAVDPTLGDTKGTPVAAGDAVAAAVALAVWRHQGLPPQWPTRQPLRSR